MLWGIDGETGDKIYQSEQFGCSTLDIGSAAALISDTSFVIVCTDTVAYFST